MNLAAIEARIAEAVRLVLGAAVDVQAYDRESRWRAALNVKYRILNAPARGRDERRYDPVTETERVVGVRRLVVQFTIETQAQAFAASAWASAESLRTGFHSTDVQNILRVAGLSVASTGTPLNVDYLDEHRRTRSAVVLEVFFGVTSRFTAETGAAGRVDQIEIEGAVTDGPDVPLQLIPKALS